jgi:hypothetical protein
MLVKLTDQAALPVLGALRRIATAGGGRPMTAADRRALDAFDRFVLRRDPATDLDDLPETSPTQLAAALQSADGRTHVVQFLIVMALVDGVIDEGKIPIVIDYAKALDVFNSRSMMPSGWNCGLFKFAPYGMIIGSHRLPQASS